MRLDEARKILEPHFLNGDNRLNDKVHQKEIVPPHYRCPYIVWNGSHDELTAFLASLENRMVELYGSSTEYVVVKGRDGTGANKVDPFRVDDMNGIYAALKKYRLGDAIVEGFVPSTPLDHPYESTKHDGCMRYICDAIVMREHGRMLFKIIFEARYWRLAPDPLPYNFRPNWKQAIASYSRFGIPTHAKEEHVSLVRDASLGMMSNGLESGFYYSYAESSAL